jgi:MinD superfamily P-loop ATPase
MKEIVVISGKGGTGKTTIATCLSCIMKNKIIVDTDVDAADMFILLNIKVLQQEEFIGAMVAIIDEEKCTGCGLCEKYCRFDAIFKKKDRYFVDPMRCEGCTLCSLVCPEKAIRILDEVIGSWFVSDTEHGKLVHARLNPGAENSGNLVAKVKKKAYTIAEEENTPYILVDGPPGIGCPVISSLCGASIALLITEPTFSGIHDLERAVDLSNHFGIKASVIINKYDINKKISEKIKDWCEKNRIEVLAEIPFMECIDEALMNKRIAYDVCPLIKEIINRVWEKINAIF